MAAVDEIAAKLGLKTADFKAALKDANADVKRFKDSGKFGEDEGLSGSLKGIKKQFGDLKTILQAGGVITAVTSFYTMAAARAEELKGVQDENAAAVRRFGEGIKETKSFVADFAVLAVGSFNRLGEAIGDAINIARMGFGDWAAAQDKIAETAAAAEVAEKRLADVRKHHGAEFAAITKELEALEKKSQDQKLKGLDVYETERNLFAKLRELREAMGNQDLTAIERRRLALDIAKTQLAADDATLAVKKDQVQVQKKMADESEKAAEKAKKERDELKERAALDQAEGLELFLLQKKRADQLTEADKERLKVLTLQKQQKQVQVDIEILHGKLVKGEITPAEEERLKALIKQDAKLQEQIDKLIAARKVLSDISNLPPVPAPPVVATRKEVFELNKEWDNFVVKVTNKGDVRTLTDTQLSALVGRLRAQIAQGEAAGRLQTNPFDLGNHEPAEVSAFRLNLTAAVQEQALRNSFRFTLGRFGETAAESRFSPEAFNRLMQLVDPDLIKQQAQDTRTLVTGLRNVFPNQFGGIR